MPTAATAPSRWIAGPGVDLAVLYGGAGLALAAGLLVVAQPAWLVPLLWVWLLAVDGPHLLATGLRVHFDPARRHTEAGRPRLLLHALLWPLLALAGARLAPALRTMDLLAAAGALYSWHHLMRQHEGIHAIYHAQTAPPGSPSPARPLVERRWLRLWLWSAYAALALSAPVMQQAARPWLGDAAGAPLDAAAWVARGLCGAAVAAYLWEGVHRLRHAASLRPWAFGLLPVGTVSTLALLWLGAHEPLAGAASHPDQWFLGVTLVTGFVHGTQYALVVLAAQRRRHAGGQGRLAWLALRPGATLTLGALICVLLYGALNASRGTLPGMHWFDPSSLAAQAALALYWGLFFHHYAVDARIWRVRGDAGLRRELGID